MTSIDSKLVLLTCADERQARRLLGHGSRRAPALAGVPAVALPTLPDRADIDSVLAERDPRRVIVHGSDAALAAVLVRLLRTDRLDVELAFLPSGRSAAAAVWSLPKDPALALDGTATPVPLVRDDAGGVLVGRGEIRNMHGECYCDETLVLRGSAPWLVVAPSPDGIAVRAGRSGKLPDGTTRPVSPKAPSGRGSALGRAVQLGGESMTVVHDGVEHPRPVPRWTWYRHTTDWLLVRPA